MQDCYDEIRLVAYLALFITEVSDLPGSWYGFNRQPHLCDVSTIENRWTFNCIFAQIAK